MAGAAISGAISAAAYADWIEKSRKQLSRHTWLFLAINDAVLPERLSNGRTDSIRKIAFLAGNWRELAGMRNRRKQKDCAGHSPILGRCFPASIYKSRLWRPRMQWRC